MLSAAEAHCGGRCAEYSSRDEAPEESSTQRLAHCHVVQRVQSAEGIEGLQRCWRSAAEAPRLQRREVESLARLVAEPLLLASLVRSHLLGAELVGDLHEAVHDLHHAGVGTSGERSCVAGAVFAANAMLSVAGLESLRLFPTVEVVRQQLRRLLNYVRRRRVHVCGDLRYSLRKSRQRSLSPTDATRAVRMRSYVDTTTSPSVLPCFAVPPFAAALGIATLRHGDPTQYPSTDKCTGFFSVYAVYAMSCQALEDAH